MSDYINNLDRGDLVLCVSINRPGVVTAQPRESSRFVKVRLQGNNTPKSIDIADLRLVVDGRAEDVPPYNGQLPEQAVSAAPASRGYSSIPNMVAAAYAAAGAAADATTYAYAAAAYAADAAAAAARSKTIKQCAEIVRTFYPELPQ